MRVRRLNTLVEVLCVLVVLTAVAALIAWIVLHDSGGALFQG
jgi:hypothetical protein